MSIEVQPPKFSPEEFDKVYDAGEALERLDTAIESIEDNANKESMSGLRDDLIESTTSYSGARLSLTMARRIKDYSVIEESDERRRVCHKSLIATINALVRNCQRLYIDFDWTNFIDKLGEKIKDSKDPSLEKVIDFDKDRNYTEEIGNWAEDCARYLTIQNIIKRESEKVA